MVATPSNLTPRLMFVISNKSGTVSSDRKKMSQAITNGMAKPATNPYGDGTASRKIVNVLREIEINAKLLNKEMAY